jgi:putative transposase
MMNPEDKYIIISDNLNTHKSETLVKLIAEDEKIDSKLLGAEEKYGILKSMASRAEFLGDDSHRVVFKYTPRHCSRLNQIECLSGILGRQLLNRRASFASAGDLEGEIRAFADFCNSNMKKPFKWILLETYLRYSL